jgi:XRE family aerobic/anaerobic benzoate catabolism transcriptional regulator
MDRKPILSDLGRRLREARRKAGLSLTELALRAGVSRRYATEAEAGRANLSVLKLLDLARSARIPVRDLLASPLGERKGERIALVGLRGAGKSTVGRALALLLEAPFVELDERVEVVAGLTLGEIFDLHGEEHFHRLEAEALERVLSEGDRVVIATGGSIVESPGTFARLRETCRTVWLKAQAKHHMERVVAQGDRRPMQNHPRAMAELATRIPIRHFIDHGPMLDTGSVALSAGWHPIVLEYYENGGGAQQPLHLNFRSLICRYETWRLSRW